MAAPARAARLCSGPPSDVVTVCPTCNGVGPVEMISSSAVSRSVWTASSGFLIPGSSTMIWLLPRVWITGSLTPRPLTRRSIVSRVPCKVSALTVCPKSAGGRASSSTCSPPCRSSPWRTARLSRQPNGS